MRNSKSEITGRSAADNDALYACALTTLRTTGVIVYQENRPHHPAPQPHGHFLSHFLSCDIK